MGKRLVGQTRTYHRISVTAPVPVGRMAHHSGPNHVHIHIRQAVPQVLSAFYGGAAKPSVPEPAPTAFSPPWFRCAVGVGGRRSLGREALGRLWGYCRSPGGIWDLSAQTVQTDTDKVVIAVQPEVAAEGRAAPCCCQPSAGKCFLSCSQGTIRNLRPLLPGDGENLRQIHAPQNRRRPTAQIPLRGAEVNIRRSSLTM